MNKIETDLQGITELISTQGVNRPIRREFADNARTAYLNLLNSDSDPSSKAFAQSAAFQRYLVPQAQRAELGPYFVELLNIIQQNQVPQDEREGLLDIFAEMDTNYFWFQEYLGNDNVGMGDRQAIEDMISQALSGGDETLAEAKQRAYENFTSANRVLIDGAKNQENPSWRNFILRSFPFLYDLVRFKHNPHHYESLTFMESMERLKDEPHTLEAVDQISKDLVSLADQGLRPGLIFKGWIGELGNGQIQAQELPQAMDNLKKVKEQENQMYRDRAISGEKRNILERQLSRLYRSAVVLKYADCVGQLMSNGIFPAPNLIIYLINNGINAIEQLLKLQDETSRGQFDPKNLVQRDMEYTHYLDSALKLQGGESGDAFSGYFEDFSELPFVPEKERPALLTPLEQMEAEAAAFEAANLYSFIQKRAASRRKLAVIGNERYGAYFVVDPLRPFLEELGVQISTYYIHSSDVHENTEGTAQSIKTSIERGNIDDLIIVDGTSNSFSGDIPRLPASMMRYRTMFAIKGKDAREYKIAHWVPVPSDKIVVGTGSGETYVVPVTDESPQIILANPVIEPGHFNNFPSQLHEHQTGFLDDPEKYAKQEKKIVFTERGVEVLNQDRTEREFVDVIQTHMARVLPQYIRELDRLI